jgi:hypothetical protein
MNEQTRFYLKNHSTFKSFKCSLVTTKFKFLNKKQFSIYFYVKIVNINTLYSTLFFKYEILHFINFTFKFDPIISIILNF